MGIASKESGGLCDDERLKLPKSVAEMLIKWKEEQDKIKETLGDEYMNYNLVMATPFGLPITHRSIW